MYPGLLDHRVIRQWRHQSEFAKPFSLIQVYSLPNIRRYMEQRLEPIDNAVISGALYKKIKKWTDTIKIEWWNVQGTWQSEIRLMFIRAGEK
jgi:hypothetical protein